MTGEFSSVPAIDVGDEGVTPWRRAWHVIAGDPELAALRRVADAVAEHPDPFALDDEAMPVLASAIEVVELVAGLKGSSTSG
jgi:hypothetical protein